MASVLKTARAERRAFKATVLARVQADPTFRDALLKVGIDTMLAGDVDTGKAILRDDIRQQSASSNSASTLGHRPRA